MTVALRQIKFCAVKYHGQFIWIIILFDEGFKYGDVAKYRGYVGRNVDLLYAEFCIVCNVVSF
jgi:hypothetical protein